MSTKTLRKRIALVAVATLGAGVLSVAPANAGNTASAVTAITPSGTAANGICVASASSGTTMLVGGSLTVTTTGIASDGTFANDTFTASGPLAFTAASAGTVTSSALVTAGDADISTSTVTVRATALGSGTIAYKAQGASVLQTLNVTVVDACASGVSASNTYIQVNDLSTGYVYTAANIAAGNNTVGSDNSASLAMDNSVDYPSTSFVNGGTAYLHVGPRTVYKGAVTSGFLSVTATNGALVNNIAGGATAAVTTSYGNVFTVTQPTFGAPLTTTLTISHNGTVLGTKTITITGDLASMTTSYVYSGTSGNTATQSNTAGTGRIGYKLFDSAKNWLTNSSSLYPVTLDKSSNPAVINTATQDGSYYSNPAGLASGRFFHNCIGAATSGSATLTFKATSKAGVSITSTVDATCSGGTANYTASFDKATYNVGDIATLTIKATDSNGKAVADKTELGYGGKSTVAVPGMTAVTAPVSTDLSSGGAWEYQYTVGTTTGSFSAAVTIPDADVQTAAAISAYKIVDNSSGVSNADVLKAIVSLIASINKQIAALQKALLKK